MADDAPDFLWLLGSEEILQLMLPSLMAVDDEFPPPGEDAA